MRRWYYLYYLPNVCSTFPSLRDLRNNNLSFFGSPKRDVYNREKREKPVPRSEPCLFFLKINHYGSLCSSGRWPTFLYKSHFFLGNPTVLPVSPVLCKSDPAKLLTLLTDLSYLPWINKFFLCVSWFLFFTLFNNVTSLGAVQCECSIQQAPSRPWRV